MDISVSHSHNGRHSEVKGGYIELIVILINEFSRIYPIISL